MEILVTGDSKYLFSWLRGNKIDPKSFQEFRRFLVSFRASKMQDWFSLDERIFSRRLIIMSMFGASIFVNVAYIPKYSVRIEWIEDWRAHLLFSCWMFFFSSFFLGGGNFYFSVVAYCTLIFSLKIEVLSVMLLNAANLNNVILFQKYNFHFLIIKEQSLLTH